MMTTDLAVARQLASVVTLVGEGRIRRVVLIGSRARGDARPDSDIDLAVIVEPDGMPWGPRDVAAERLRLQRVLDQQHAPPPRAEIFVTTADQFVAGRTIFGGVDWQIETEGVPLYTEAFRRQPVARRTPAQVRNGYAATWVQHALRALEAAYREPDAARVALERALVALLVIHGAPASKRAGVDGFLRVLLAHDPGFVRWVEQILDGGITAVAARAVLKGVLDRISADPMAAKYVAETRAIVAGPAVYIPR